MFLGSVSTNLTSVTNSLQGTLSKKVLDDHPNVYVDYNKIYCVNQDATHGGNIAFRDNIPAELSDSQIACEFRMTGGIIVDFLKLLTVHYAI